MESLLTLHRRVREPCEPRTEAEAAEEVRVPEGHALRPLEGRELAAADLAGRGHRSVARHGRLKRNGAEDGIASLA
jgi:hypothetical protein